MSELVVEEAGLDQISVVLEIERSAGQRFVDLLERAPHLGLVLPDDETPTEELEEAIKSGLCWIASWAGRPCGFVYSSSVGRRPDDHQWDTATALFVEELDVVPEYGRRGIGTRLMLEVEVKARTLGCSHIALTTFRSVPWNAPWYGRLGFVELRAESNAGIAATDIGRTNTAFLDGRLRRTLLEKLVEEEQRGFDLSQRVLMTKAVSRG